MEKVYDTCCGIDVHKKLMVACLKSGSKQEIRQTGATTRELLELADWLKANGCQMVAMESTGSYWKPLYNILEMNDIPAMVVNAQHMKAVPGRKTDVTDSEWIAKLVQHGLLQASYIPSKDQREMRELVRYRKSLVDDRTRELNRLQKMLEGANIKLSGTIKDINGKSARNVLEYLVAGGKFDEEKYEELYSQNQIAHNLKATKAQIIDDLNGVMSPLQRRVMKELLTHLDELNEHIQNLNDEINNSGLCPGNNESARKQGSGKTRKGNALLRATLTVCAHSAVKVKMSYYYAQYSRICAHRGKKRAIIAVAHSMLIAIYHILKDDVAYKELGAEYYNQFNRESKINACLKRLKALGWEAPTATIAALP